MEKIHFRSGFSIYSFHTPKWVLSWSIILELVHLHSVSISLNSRRSPSDGLFAPITLLDNDSFLKAWSSMLSFYIFEKKHTIFDVNRFEVRFLAGVAMKKSLNLSTVDKNNWISTFARAFVTSRPMICPKFPSKHAIYCFLTLGRSGIFRKHVKNSRL